MVTLVAYAARLGFGQINEWPNGLAVAPAETSASRSVGGVKVLPGSDSEAAILEAHSMTAMALGIEIPSSFRFVSMINMAVYLTPPPPTYSVRA